MTSAAAATAVLEPLAMDLLLASLERLAGLVGDGLPDEERRRLADLRRDPDLAAAQPARIRLPDRALITLALLDDCLRVLHRGLEADGVVEVDELDHAFPLIYLAASRYGRSLDRYREFAAVDSDGAARFLATHRGDPRPFGLASAATAWLGLDLCAAAARRAASAELLDEYERMALRLMDEVIAVGGVTDAERDVRQQLSLEIADRLRARRPPDAAGADPRDLAFCRRDAEDVFGSVAQSAHIHSRDPLDVETIHADARAVFERLLAQATTPARHDVGRILLIRGESGSGKTHLMRAFRAMVHGPRLGFCSYASLTSDTGDYARYLLVNLIDSMEKPYDPPELDRQSLVYLSDGLAELGDAISPDQLERLRNDEMGHDQLGGAVGDLVSRLLRTEALGDVDVDVVHALLLIQRRDPAITKRVIKFLRCDDLTPHERGVLGGLAPRLAPEAPLRMIEQLGRLAWATQQAALVLLVDQMEDIHDLESGRDRFRRAVAALRATAERLPSVIVVMACLDDLWAGLRDRVSQADRDRLERDPPPVLLRTQRNLDEIEAMVARRLENLYAPQGNAFRADEPLYPFTRAQLEPLVNQRARDVLTSCKRFQEACIARGQVVAGGDLGGDPGRGDDQGGAPGRMAALTRVWNDLRVAQIDVPEDEAALAELLAGAAAAISAELASSGAELRARRDGARVSVDAVASGGTAGSQVVGVTNASPRGGGLQRQIEELAAARGGRPAVAVRTTEFPANAKTKVAQSLAAFVSSDNRVLVIDNDTFRTIAALRELARRPDVQADLAAWRREARPLSSIPALRDLFELDRLAAAAAAARAMPLSAVPAQRMPPTTPTTPTTRAPAPPPGAATGEGARPPLRPVGDPARLRIGVSASLREQAVDVAASDLLQHAVFLGSTGSGKTTVALNLIEQLLERGTPAILVDRKGDLCRYASDAWWAEVPDDPEQARRKRALRERIDVRLFTPGDARGRDLILPLLPAGWSGAHETEREKMAKHGAAALAALMRYGQSETHAKRTAVLKAALEIDGGRTPTLADLIDLVERPDDELTVRVSNLRRFFQPVAEDLQTLGINFGHLLAAHGETLDVGACMTPARGRTPLTIISTRFLGETTTLLFWVSRLLADLTRWLEQHPSGRLQGAALFDEADLYLPATSSPATKEPMMDLLRRARSKGFGVLLASQNPGDFDYRGRENINTWFVGKVSQDRTLGKLRDLLGDTAAAGLPNLPRGQFFLVRSPPPREVRADRSLMDTIELGPDEVLALARATRG
ncbi:MAG TPA: type IV secretion system DNA-binding domain-containing protein [Kofleriaceae bacterium]|nr:type IV secretion system DNA-binding domain-containing protein [Kofleriaceae bacterium]